MTTTNSWNSEAITSVSLGGTGVSSKTAYAIQCGGTTTTSPDQSIASVGTSGQVLQSNGAAALPSFGTGGGSGTWVLIQSQTVGVAVASINFTDIDDTYNTYKFLMTGLYPSSNNASYVRVGTGGTPTYQSGASDYSSDSRLVTAATSAQIQITGSASGPINSGANLGFILTLSQPANTAIRTNIDWSGAYYTATNTIERQYGTANYNSDTAVTAIKFIPGGGLNFSSGTIALYGVVT